MARSHQAELFQLGEEDLCAAIEEFARPARMETIFESCEDDLMMDHHGAAAAGTTAMEEAASKDVGIDHYPLPAAAPLPPPCSSSPRLVLQQSVLAWCETTGLPITVKVHVEDRSFELHELPLVSRSGYFKRILQQHESEVELGSDFPGGAHVFSMVASFCYGATILVEPGNVAQLRCAGEYLEMGEEFGKGNLCELSDMYLRKVALQSWEGSYAVLAGIDKLLPLAEELLIVSRCIDSLAYIACTELLDDEDEEQDDGDGYLGDQEKDCHKNLIRNKIKKDNRSRRVDELLQLPYGLFSRIIAAIRRQGMRERQIGAVLIKFVERWIFEDDHHHHHHLHVEVPVPVCKDHYLWCHENLEQLSLRSDKCRLLESTVRLLPLERHVVPVSFLFSLLRCALGVGASTECRVQLETRIACQLELASVEDLLAPVKKEGRISKAQIESIRQIVSLFMQQQMNLKQQQTKVPESKSGLWSSSRSFKQQYATVELDELEGPSSSFVDFQAVVSVARVWDAYLEQLGHEAGISPVTFSELIDAIPACARTSHDQLYKAIHIYLKAHPHVTQSERVLVCKSLNCQKLSQEACIHAVQNDHMPLRTIVQAMFMEQLQNRGEVPPQSHHHQYDHLSSSIQQQQPYKDIRISDMTRSSSHRFHQEQLTLDQTSCKNRSTPAPPADHHPHHHKALSHTVNGHDFEAAKLRLKYLEKELAQVKKALQQNSCPGPGIQHHLNDTNNIGLNRRSSGASASCIGQMLHSQRTGISLGHKLLRTFKKLGIWKGKYNACYDASSSEDPENFTATGDQHDDSHPPPHAAAINNNKASTKRPFQHRRSHSVS